MNRSIYRSNGSGKESICPLCSGEMTRKEKETRLCSCGFQICHWCLSKQLSTNNVCPNCGKPYSNYVIHLVDNMSDSQYDDDTSSSGTDRERNRNNRYFKGSSYAQNDLHYLQSVRIIQHNLVYIIGLAPHLAVESTLRSTNFFGKYGTIKKVILNNSPQLIEKVHSCCAYITYSKPQEAYNCIMACDGVVLQGSQIRASFGTTKYCNFYLRGIHCTNADCMYLHSMADESDCFTKKEMQTRQSEFYAKTHPCHSDSVDVEIGEDLNSLPSLKTTSSASSQKNSISSTMLKTVIPEVFGDVTVNCNDYSQYMINDLLTKPFECSKTSLYSWDIKNLPSLLGMEPTSSLKCSDNVEIDVNFLFQADEFIQRMQKQNESSSEVWDWKSTQRANSIDSNVSVEV